MENKSFIINLDVLRAIDDYHTKSLSLQKYHFEGNEANVSYSQLKESVNDDLIFNVPIYDMLDRKYASFSSFLEALKNPDDPKGNNEFFPDIEMNRFKWILLFYLFRLCGSGINYKPKDSKESEPFGTHGFGNFWLVDAMRHDVTDSRRWYDWLMSSKDPFTNNRGYLLPQFSYEGLKKGHLKKFILDESYDMITCLYSYLKAGEDSGTTIIEAVRFSNDYLTDLDYKRQNFVLSATMADIAEYYPELIDPNSMIFAGTNAKKCIRAIFTKKSGVNTLKFESDCIRFLAHRYNSNPYSVEDSRLCDVVRYFKEYQSQQHIQKNKGIVYKNNSVLKKLWGDKKYYEFANSL